MKICTLTYTYSPYSKGGADMYAENISKQLSDKGHEVIVIAAKPTFDKSLSYTVEVRDGIKIYWFYPLNVSSFYNIAKKSHLMQGIWRLLDIWNIHSYYIVKKILKREMPDVVHAHTPVGLSPSVFKAVKSLGIPLIFTLHDYYSICPRITLLRSSDEICTKPNMVCKAYLKLNRKLIGNKPDVVIGPSKFVMDMHVDNNLFNNSKKIILPHGIENKVMNSAIEPHTKGERIDLLYVGGLAKHKGVHVLIKAFKQIKHNNMRLNIVGKGICEKELKELAKGDPRIIFRGHVPDNDLKTFYEQSDFLIAPSIFYETFGLVILESFSCGTPVISSKIGAYQELIIDGYNGFLIEAGDTGKLKNIIEYCLKNINDLHVMGQNASTSAKKFKMLDHIRKLEEIYAKISE